MAWADLARRQRVEAMLGGKEVSKGTCGTRGFSVRTAIRPRGVRRAAEPVEERAPRKLVTRLPSSPAMSTPTKTSATGGD
jgi:hypothetical protein